MCLFLSKDRYIEDNILLNTGCVGRHRWPIIPFSILKQSREEETSTGIPLNFQTEYTIGFERDHIVGWSMGISEIIKKPVLTWYKRITKTDEGIDWQLDSAETTEFYEIFSPICGKCRKLSDAFHEKCNKNDREKVEFIFRNINNETDEKSEADKLAFFNSTAHTSGIRADIYNDRLYYYYTCDTMQMVELIFPVMCEGITIALVMVGQLVEDANLGIVKEQVALFNKKQVSSIIDEDGDVAKIHETDFPNVKEISVSDRIFIIERVAPKIDNLEQIFSGQVKQQRSEILNEAFDILMRFQNGRLGVEHDKYFLFKDRRGITCNTLDIYEGLNLRNRFMIDYSKEPKSVRRYILRFFDAGLTFLRNYFNVAHVFVYMDEDLKSEIKNITKPEDGEPPIRNGWYQEPSDVSNLFSREFFRATPNADWQLNTTEQLRPKGSSDSKDEGWSVYLYHPVDRENIPLLSIGIKYKSALEGIGEETGGKENKASYLHANDSNLFWETHVLDKYIVVLENMLLSYDAYKKQNDLEKHRAFFEHETFNIAMGINGLVLSYKGKINPSIPDIVKLPEDIKRKCVEFPNDVEGQFKIVSMLSYSVQRIQNPQKEFGSPYKKFMYRWQFAFNPQFSRGNRNLHVMQESEMAQVYGNSKLLGKIIETDFRLWEQCIYNVLSNALKYSYDYTTTYIDYSIETDDSSREYAVFTIISFGREIKQEDSELIYDYGVRGSNIDRNSLGQGIGLYLCKEILEHLGGKITHAHSVLEGKNISYVNEFIDRYTNSVIFAEFWNNYDNSDYEFSRPNYEEIHNIYETYKSNQQDRHCMGVAKEDAERLILPIRQVSFETLVNEISRTIYRTEFSIRIPTKGGIIG